MPLENILTLVLDCLGEIPELKYTGNKNLLETEDINE